MLYDFHREQTRQKPGSVWATYLVDGLQASKEDAAATATNGQRSEDGDDVPMQSSPYMSSSAPQPDQEIETVYSRCLMIAREEDLEGEIRPFSFFS